MFYNRLGFRFWIFALFVLIIKGDFSTLPLGLAKPSKGHLILAGGDEIPMDAIYKMFSLTNKIDPLLVIIPTADGDFWVDDYSKEQKLTIERWNLRGFNRVEILHTTSRDNINEDFIVPLENADCVWLSGGNQNRLIEVYKDTLVEQALVKVLKRGKVIGGTSAGSAVCSEYMIAYGEKNPVIKKGFGFIPVVIDTHFYERERFDRLKLALFNLGSANQIGFGISERSAVHFDLSIQFQAEYGCYGARKPDVYSSYDHSDRLIAHVGY